MQKKKDIKNSILNIIIVILLSLWNAKILVEKMDFAGDSYDKLNGIIIVFLPFIILALVIITIIIMMNMKRNLEEKKNTINKVINVRIWKLIRLVGISLIIGAIIAFINATLYKIDWANLPELALLFSPFAIVLYAMHTISPITIGVIITLISSLQLKYHKVYLENNIYTQEILDKLRN